MDPSGPYEAPLRAGPATPRSTVCYPAPTTKGDLDPASCLRHGERNDQCPDLRADGCGEGGVQEFMADAIQSDEVTACAEMSRI